MTAYVRAGLVPVYTSNKCFKDMSRTAYGLYTNCILAVASTYLFTFMSVRLNLSEILFSSTSYGIVVSSSVQARRAESFNSSHTYYLALSD